MNWLTSWITLALAALIIAATLFVLRHREMLRAAARDAQDLEVLSEDTHRAIAVSTASPPPKTAGPVYDDSSEDDGGADDGGE